MATTQPDLLATLWSSPEGVCPPPPVSTKQQLLPIGELSWENAERLFTRLLDMQAHVAQATLFGVSGQRQDGIDVYARRVPTLNASQTPGRTYLALQSRRVQKITAAAIGQAITDFLAGEWAAKSSAFYLATSHSLRDIKLDGAVRAAREQLTAEGIEFVQWGSEELAGLLRDQPRLVDDFFGRAWVEQFCGEDQAARLGRRISPDQARAARDGSESCTGRRFVHRALFRPSPGHTPVICPTWSWTPTRSLPTCRRPSSPRLLKTT